MNKKIISLILTFALIAGSCACGAQKEMPPQSSVEKIQKEGFINIEAKNSYGETEFAIATRIAEDLGVEAVYTSGAFDITLGIISGEYADDMFLSDGYKRERIQVLSTKYTPLAEYEEYSYSAGMEKTDFNKDLLDSVNVSIADYLRDNQGNNASLDLEDGSIGTPDKSKAYVYENHPELTAVRYDSPKLLGISEDMGLEYQDSLIIVCDSPNYWLKPFELLTNGKNTKQIWTGAEGTQTFPYYKGFKLYDPNDPANKKTLIDLAKTYQPEVMLVALGINGIAKRDEESFSKIYKQMISDLKEACPDTTFILASIYPVTDTYKNLSIINNELITAGNSWILKTAESYDCFYLDISSVLIGDDGFAKKELMQKDGLHPNKDGLQLVLDYIRTHACIQ